FRRFTAGKILAALSRRIHLLYSLMHIPPSRTSHAIVIFPSGSAKKRNRSRFSHTAVHRSGYTLKHPEKLCILIIAQAAANEKVRLRPVHRRREPDLHFLSDLL